MPTEAVIIFVALAASFGTLAVIAVGARCTRNLQVLGWGGICSGAALAALAYFCLGWFAHGFEPQQAWVLPLAGLVLLLVMVAQNWFVFYEDREDLAQSARPTLVMLAAAPALWLAATFGDWRSGVQLTIWASAASAALVLSIQPVQRSIAANRSLTVGILVGIGKLLVPPSGVIALVLIDRIHRSRRDTQRDHQRKVAPQAFDSRGLPLDLLLLIWEFGQLLLVTLTNGQRFVHDPALPDSPGLDAAHKRGQSAASQMPLSARNTAVLMLVVAVHLLCGLIVLSR